MHIAVAIIMGLAPLYLFPYRAPPLLPSSLLLSLTPLLQACMTVDVLTYWYILAKWSVEYRGNTSSGRNRSGRRIGGKFNIRNISGIQYWELHMHSLTFRGTMVRGITTAAVFTDPFLKVACMYEEITS